jgi:hypothetical protein
MENDDDGVLTGEIACACRYQQTPYNLAPVPVVRDFLLEAGRTLSDAEAYQRSRLVQPQKVTID